MQLCLGHGPLEAQKEAVVEVCRVVDAILIENQRVGQRADFQEPMPVRGVSRQTRDLKSHHDTRAAHTDLHHEPLKAFAVGR